MSQALGSARTSQWGQYHSHTPLRAKVATVLQSVVITTVLQPKRVLAPDASLGWFVSGVQTLGLGPSGICYHCRLASCRFRPCRLMYFLPCPSRTQQQSCFSATQRTLLGYINFFFWFRISWPWLSRKIPVVIPKLWPIFKLWWNYLNTGHSDS